MESSKVRKKGKTEALSLKDMGRKILMHIVYFLLGLLVSKGAVLGSLAPFGAAYAASVPFSFSPVFPVFSFVKNDFPRGLSAS